MMKNILFIICLLCTSKFYANESCLIACYPFSGNAENAIDTIYNGIVNGATLSTDRFGNPNQAYQFDGIDDYINLGLLNSMNNTDEFTYSFWCSAKFASTTNMPIRTQPDNGADRMAFSVNYVGGSPTRLFFDYGDIFSSGRISSSSQPYDNLWHHYVFIRSTSGNFRKVYIDGVLFLNDVAGDILDDKNRELWIGGGIHETGVNEFHNGKIDDIKIYKCALSETEVGMLYNETNICQTINNINKVENSKLVKTYPNPSNGKFHIDIDDNNFDLELVDLMGNKIQTLSNVNSNQLIKFDILLKGTYILKVVAKNNTYNSMILIE